MQMYAESAKHEVLEALERAGLYNPDTHVAGVTWDDGTVILTVTRNGEDLWSEWWALNTLGFSARIVLESDVIFVNVNAS